MIVWGFSTKEIGIKEAPGKCPSCGLQNLVIVGSQCVFDLFWIPIIPLKKSTYVRCQSCKTTYVHEPSADETAIQNSGFKTPWWSFSGLLIIIVLIILGYMSDTSTQKEHDTFKENPTIGTYFTFRNIGDDYKETPYVFGEIVSLEEDKIILRMSHYAYSKNNMASKGARAAKINPENLLDLDVFAMQKEDFKNLDIQSLID